MIDDLDRELSVGKGEYLEVMDDTKKWWHCRNSAGETGFVPHTLLKALIYTDVSIQGAFSCGRIMIRMSRIRANSHFFKKLKDSCNSPVSPLSYDKIQFWEKKDSSQALKKRRRCFLGTNLGRNEVF